MEFLLPCPEGRRPATPQRDGHGRVPFDEQVVGPGHVPRVRCPELTAGEEDVLVRSVGGTADERRPFALRELHVPEPELVPGPGHSALGGHGVVGAPEIPPHVDVLGADLATEAALVAGRDEARRHGPVPVQGARRDGDLNLLVDPLGELLKVAQEGAVADAGIAPALNAPGRLGGGSLLAVPVVRRTHWRHRDEGRGVQDHPRRGRRRGASHVPRLEPALEGGGSPQTLSQGLHRVRSGDGPADEDPGEACRHGEPVGTNVVQKAEGAASAARGHVDPVELLKELRQVRHLGVQAQVVPLVHELPIHVGQGGVGIGQVPQAPSDPIRPLEDRDLVFPVRQAQGAAQPAQTRPHDGEAPLLGRHVVARRAQVRAVRQDGPLEIAQGDGGVHLPPRADRLAGAVAEGRYDTGESNGVREGPKSRVETAPPHPGGELPDVETEGAGGGAEGLLLLEALLLHLLSYPLQVAHALILA